MNYSNFAEEDCIASSHLYYLQSGIIIIKKGLHGFFQKMSSKNMVKEKTKWYFFKRKIGNDFENNIFLKILTQYNVRNIKKKISQNTLGK